MSHYCTYWKSIKVIDVLTKTYYFMNCSKKMLKNKMDKVSSFIS